MGGPLPPRPSGSRHSPTQARATRTTGPGRRPTPPAAGHEQRVPSFREGGRYDLGDPLPTLPRFAGEEDGRRTRVRAVGLPPAAGDAKKLALAPPSTKLALAPPRNQARSRSTPQPSSLSLHPSTKLALAPPLNQARSRPTPRRSSLSLQSSTKLALAPVLDQARSRSSPRPSSHSRSTPQPSSLSLYPSTNLALPPPLNQLPSLLRNRSYPQHRLQVLIGEEQPTPHEELAAPQRVAPWPAARPGSGSRAGSGCRPRPRGSRCG